MDDLTEISISLAVHSWRMCFEPNAQIESEPTSLISIKPLKAITIEMTILKANRYRHTNTRNTQFYDYAPKWLLRGIA